MLAAAGIGRPDKTTQSPSDRPQMTALRPPAWQGTMTDPSSQSNKRDRMKTRFAQALANDHIWDEIILIVLLILIASLLFR